MDRAVISVKGVNPQLLREINIAAIQSGLTVRAWIIEALTREVEVGGSQRQPDRLDTRVTHPAPVEEVGPVEHPCGDCGKAMVRNFTLKRWECVCGWSCK
jgi:hypothetical protein